MSSLKNALALGLLVSAALVPALAHAGKGCSGHDVSRRNLGGPLRTYTKRQTEQSEAQILDPADECAYYSYAPSLALKSSYPTPWETATILSGDTEAETLFQSINDTVNTRLPGNAPSGIGNYGNTSNVHYNNSDPNCWWTWKECTTPAASTGIPADLTRVEPGTWGFGFDDGPNCSHNALYDFLMEQDQKATMFYIGSNVMDWPLQALRAIDDGHEICVHTWSHQYMTGFTNDIAFAELYYTRQVIKDILGVTPKCWRPPYGDVDNRIRLIAEGLNLTTIVWSDDTEDWKVDSGQVTSADVDANYQAIITSMQNGSYASAGPIVLNHELTNYTMGEMMKWYPQIKSTFKYVVPIFSAENWTHPYVEQNYTYPDFEQYTAGQINDTVGAVQSTSSSSSSAAATGSSTASGSAASSGSKSSGTASSASASASKTSSAQNTVVALRGGLAGMAVALVGTAGLLSIL